jgi:ACR3 family arsenite efflux pump ArsB
MAFFGWLFFRHIFLPLIGASNFFELAVPTAIALYGR